MLPKNLAYGSKVESASVLIEQIYSLKMELEITTQVIQL